MEQKTVTKRTLRTPYEKHKLRRRCSGVCIAIGLLLLLAVVGRTIYDQIRIGQVYRAASTQLVPLHEVAGTGYDAENGDANESLNEDGIGASAGEAAANTESEKSTSTSGNGLVTWGVLEIPKIDLKMIVSEGINDSVLQYSLGHMEETALPGTEEGNCVISGHRSYVYGRQFNRLNEIEVGDEMSLRTAESTYEYVVTEIFVVEPDDVSVIQWTQEPVLTLITCTPIVTATHRLIVRCSLSNTKSVDEMAVSSYNGRT